jgi:hypothetical protein
MANTEAVAKRWMSWLLTRDEIPFRSALGRYFANPKLARLCDCGCNSFDLAIPEETNLPALCTPGGNGMFFELNFSLPENKLLEFLFFSDNSGRLRGVDIEVSGNNFPVPERPAIGKLVHTWASPAMLPQS